MRHTLLRISLLLLLLAGLLGRTSAQEAEKPAVDHSYKPLMVKLSDDGSKYVRFIIWHQQWMQTNNLAADNAGLSVSHLARRSRFLAYAQVSPRFLILTHIGLNNLSPGNLTSLGNNGDSPQFFLHDAWTEFKVSNNDALYIGGGLHYWNGLTRMSNESTLNFMTLDNPRPFVHWHSLAVTDQFARHLGIYAKGDLGKFSYRVAFNNPGRNGIQANLANRWDAAARPAIGDSLVYNGFEQRGSDGDQVGNSIFGGYMSYSFWDTESSKLPYFVGTYLGSKRVLNLGGGFFLHPNGMYNYSRGEHQNVGHFAADLFLDMPLGTNDCFNAYASLLRFNYGDNFVSRWAGTGTVFYGHVGYKLPASKFMPYVAFQNAAYDGINDPVNSLDIGLNYFINGHNAKLTLEYHSIRNDFRDSPATQGDVTQLRMQAHIFL